MEPGLPQAVLLRSLLAAGAGRMNEAIADLQQLLRTNPDNTQLRMQLALYYAADQRASKAIEVYTSILALDKEHWMALRARADVLLSLGKHAEAIADYEAAVKLRPEDEGILNNLAWVLATSPDDKVRDGKRAIEMAKKACEITDYEQPHIISTLAAGYADTDDFENAVKWSEKAVALDKDGEQKQLAKELESYRQKKPWRERQSLKEKPEPEKPKLDDLKLE